jgi:hypothetical protein
MRLFQNFSFRQASPICPASLNLVEKLGFYWFFQEFGSKSTGF